MKASEFNEIVREQLDMCETMLSKKAEEYADEIDRLHNFKSAGILQHIKPKQALAGFMAKHTVSVYDMLADDGDYTLEQWNEKITDHINYLILLSGIIREEKSEASFMMDELPTINFKSALERPFLSDDAFITVKGRHYAND